MSYAEMLHSLPAPRLRELVRRRAATLDGVPRTADKWVLVRFLASALADPGSVAAALDATDLLQLEVLVYMIAEGREVPFEHVLDEAGEDARGRIEAAVEALCGLGLLFSQDHGGTRTLVVPREVSQSIQLPLPLQLRLPRALNQYNVEVLTRIHQNLGLASPAAPRKAELIQAIGAELSNPDRLAGRVRGLPQDARNVLDFVVHNGGVASLYEVAARIDARQRSQIYTYDWAWRWAQGKPRNAIEVLMGQALLVSESTTSWGYGRFVVPGDVLQTLTGRRYFGEGTKGVPDWETVPESGGSRPVTSPGIVRDVAYFLGFLGRTDAARTSKGTIHRSALKAVAKGLSLPLPAYAGFVYALCREAELIYAQARGGIYDVTSQGAAWLGQDIGAQQRSLYDVWHAQATWAEPYHDPLNDAGALSDVGLIRSYRDSVAELLKELAADHPGQMASLASLARRAHYRWWRRFGKPDAGEEDKGENGESDAPTSPTALIRRIAAESLYWLGVTEVWPADNPTHVRLSTWGRQLLLGDEAPDPGAQRADRFVVQPNLEIYAPPDLQARLLYRLFRNAESSGNGMLTLSRDSLRRALDRGETAAGFLQFLREHSSSAVPQNVQYLIQEVGGRHGHIRVGQAGLYMQVSDPVLLKELKAQKKLGIHFRQQLADTVALIAGDSVEAVLRDLRQAGYFPVNADEDARGPQADVSRARRPQHVARPLHTTQSDVDVRIDWDAIAAQDAQGEGAGLLQVAPITGQKAIRELIERAIEQKLPVEITYQPQRDLPGTVRVIEPQAVESDMVRAFCRLRQDRRIFNIRHVTQARVAEN